MATDPAPLAAGQVLAERFSVQRVLGRGGFGIAYLAIDEVRGDKVVVKELAPMGVRRSGAGTLDLDQSGTSGHLLRQRFLQEAETLRRLHHDGIPGLRAAFAENGTAYHVTGYLPHGRTLEERLRRDGPLAEPEAREIFTSLLDILEVVHAAGVLHRDVKPSNVLLGPGGEVVLIDFGAARDWVASAAITHTIMHTPGYAPPEQLSEKAPRGAATDLYALCATIYHGLAGKPPATAPDRMAGIRLDPIGNLRPDIDPAFARAIDSGLAIRMTDRPESAAAMRARLCDPPLSTVEQSLQALDDVLVRLHQFRFDRRACPACEGLLVEPRPLRRLTCPVCREGTVRAHALNEKVCPECRIGLLTQIDNTTPLAICPECGKGLLVYRRKSLLGTAKTANCADCNACFEVDGDRMTGTESLTCDEWRLRSGRGRHVKRCRECGAQFDELPDARWRIQGKAGRAHHWDEWVRCAAGLDPNAGNAACDACGADFWSEDGRLTLLDADRDPFGFGARFVGRPLQTEDVRWIGVGKSSGEPGPVCDTCGTEFDRDGEFLRLIASPNRRLNGHVDESRPLEDWHRISRDLPTGDEEEEVLERLAPLLRNAYLNGEIAFDAEGAVWRGKAVRTGDGAEGTLEVTPNQVTFGGRFRRWRAPLDAIRSVEVDENLVALQISGEQGPVEFEVIPITLTAHLRSGDRSIELSADDLAARLSLPC